jgi:hypothetical protein
MSERGLNALVSLTTRHSPLTTRACYRPPFFGYAGFAGVTGG